MKVLLVGGGAREHAIAKVLKKGDVKMFACMNNRNPGIAKMCEDFYLVKETDVESVVDYARRKNIELCVIGPEAPLEKGIADELEKNDIKVVGPKKNAAEIETSKSFMRNLMKKYSIPGGVEYKVFDNVYDAKDFVESTGDVVVKPVGLTGGKGVKIVGEQLKDTNDALNYVKEIIENKIGGVPKVVVEEKIVGEEFTLQGFCDGKKVVPMPAVQDNKRAFENDEGPNTGGMGSYSQGDGLLPFLRKNEYDAAVGIMQKIIEAMKKEGREYKGILYGQFMLSKYGPKVIECNARFGDPEAMNVLPLLESDFVEICNRIVDGHLSNASFMKKATVCKYVVPKGYGIKSMADRELILDEKKIGKEGAELFYASVNEKKGKIYTTASRALGIVGIAESIKKAELIAESGLKHVLGEIYVRHDIGKKDYIAKKVKRMERIRR
ncbi:MAG: phosphoribosylamine--glycine ligase [Thermoplasmatales archaeon]|nr:phosphoribosylamine--glycine ligase [Thermoplasmatales archaeon]